MAGGDAQVEFTFGTNVGDIVGQIVDAMSELDSVLANSGNSGGQVGAGYLEQVDKIVAGVRTRAAEIEQTFKQALNAGSVGGAGTVGGQFTALAKEVQAATRALQGSTSPAVRNALGPNFEQSTLRPMQVLLEELTSTDAALKARYNTIAETQRAGLDKIFSASTLGRARNIAEDTLTRPGGPSEPLTTLYRAEGGIIDDSQGRRAQVSSSQATDADTGGRYFYDNAQAALNRLNQTGGNTIRVVQLTADQLAQFNEGYEDNLGASRFRLPAALARTSLPLSSPDLLRGSDPEAAARAAVAAQLGGRDVAGEGFDAAGITQPTAAEQKAAEAAEKLAEKLDSYASEVQRQIEAGEILTKEQISLAEAVDKASNRTDGVLNIGRPGSGQFVLPQFADENGNAFFRRDVLPGEGAAGAEESVPPEEVLRRITDPLQLQKVASSLGSGEQFRSLDAEQVKALAGYSEFFDQLAKDAKDLTTASRDAASKTKAELESQKSQQGDLSEQFYGKLLSNNPKLATIATDNPGDRELSNGYSQLGSSLLKQTTSGLRVVEGNEEIYKASTGLANTLNKERALSQGHGGGERDSGDGVFDSFLGGAFGHGFDTTQKFNPSSAINNLASTAGVLLRYGSSYQAIFAVEQAFKSAFDDANKFDAALVPLQNALSAVGVAQVNLNAAVSSGNALGVDNVTAIEVSTRALAAYRDEIHSSADANQVMADSVKAVGDAMILSGQDAATVQAQLIAATEGFGTGSKGQDQITSAVANAQKFYGGNYADVLQAVSTSAGAAAQSGTTPEELANIASLIQARTGDSGSTISSSLDRLVVRGSNQQFLSALSQAGVKPVGDLQNQIIQLSKAYQGMDARSKAAFESALGGARNMKDLLPLLQDGQSLSDAFAFSMSHLGAASEEAQKRMHTVSGELSQLKALLITLATNLGNSGIFTPIELLVVALKPALQLLDQLLEGFDKIGNLPGIGGPLKDVVSLTAELLLASSALNKYRTSHAATAAESAGKNATGQEADNAALAEGTAATDKLAVAQTQATATTDAQAAAQARLNATLTAGAEAATVAGGAAAAGEGALLAGGVRNPTGAGVGIAEGSAAEGEIVAASRASTAALEAESAGFVSTVGEATAGLAGMVAGINPFILALIGLPFVIEGISGVISSQLGDIRLANNPVIPGGYNGLIDQATQYANQANADQQTASSFGGRTYDFLAGTVGAIFGARSITEQAAIDRAKASELAGLAAQAKHEQDLAGQQTGDTAVFGGALTSESLQTAVQSMQTAGQSALQISQTINKAFSPGTGGAYNLQAHGNIALGDSLANALSSNLNGGSISIDGSTATNQADITNRINDKILHVIGAVSATGGVLTGDQVNQIADWIVGLYVPKGGESSSQVAKDKKNLRSAVDKALASGLGINGLFKPGDVASSAAIQQFQAQNAQTIAQQYATITGSQASGAQTALDQLNITLAQAVANNTPLDPAALAEKQNLTNQIAQGFKQDAEAIDDLTASTTSINDPVGQAMDTLKKAYDDLRFDEQTNNLDQIRQDQAAINQDQQAIRQASLAQTVAVATVFNSGSNGVPNPKDPVDLRNPLAVDQSQLVSTYTNLVHTKKFGNNGEVTAAYAQAYQAYEQAQIQFVKDQVSLQNAATTAGAQAGNPLASASAQLTNATRTLQNDEVGTAQYYTDLTALHEAQVQFAQQVAAAASNNYLLGNDTTDPVAQAKAALVAAITQQKQDKKYGVGDPRQDALNVEQAQQAQIQAKFDQRLQDQATAYSLNEESAAQYLNFLDKQHNTLERQLAGTKKGTEGYRQLVDDLNSVNQTIHSIDGQLAGAFNLGNIRKPTVYQARASLTNNLLPSATSQVKVTIVDKTSGGITAKADLATGTVNRTGVIPRKVRR